MSQISAASEPRVPSASAPVHLAIALDGAGWHPAAWREPAARPTELFTARYWARPGREAERGLVDFVTIEDSFGLQSDRPFAADERTDRVRGRLDAVLIAARVAPLTRHIGLVPDRRRHAHRAIPHLEVDRHARLREHRPCRGAGPGVGRAPRRPAHFGRRDIPDWPRRTRRPAVQHWSPSCSTRPRTTSRWCAGCGTAGRTTPRSATSPPAASSTGTSCTTSTSTAATSGQGPVDHAPASAGPAVVTHWPTVRFPYRFAARSADIVFVHTGDDAGCPSASSTRSAASRLQRRPERRPATRLRRPRGLPRHADGVAALPARPGWTSGAGSVYTSDAQCSPASPAELAELLVRLAVGRHHRLPAATGGAAGRPDRIVDALVPELQLAAAVSALHTRRRPCGGCWDSTVRPTATRPAPQPRESRE